MRGGVGNDSLYGDGSTNAFYVLATSSFSASITLNGTLIGSGSGGGGGWRGFNSLVIDPIDGQALDYDRTTRSFTKSVGVPASAIEHFDTWGSVAARDDLLDFLAKVPNHAILILAVADEAGRLDLSGWRDQLFPALEVFGAQHIREVGFREGYVLVTSRAGGVIAENVGVGAGTEISTVGRFALDGHSLDAGSGNDILEGGDGADMLDGGPGSDTASYQFALAGVHCDLLTPNVNTGEAAGDTYISIENIQGTNFNDDLRGNDVSNTIWGGAGDDVLDSRGGNDTLSGGPGNDMITGGVGADTVVFSPGDGADTITDFSAADGDKVDFSDFRTIHVLSDVLALETQVGSDDVLNAGNGDILTFANWTKGHLTNAQLIFSKGQAPSDFNGDGESDILWQNTSGQTTIWQMNGATATPGPIYNVDPSWLAVGG